MGSSLTTKQTQTIKECNTILKKQKSIIKHLKNDINTIQENYKYQRKNDKEKANIELKNLKDAMMLILIKERKLMKLEIQKNNDKIREHLFLLNRNSNGNKKYDGNIGYE